MSAGSSSEPPRGIARPPGTGARGGTKPGEAEPPRVGVPLPPVDRETAEPPGSRLIDWVARWVPVSRRDQWLAEWRAELSHASEGARSRGESERMTKWRMRRRALGGVRDARWLRGAYGVPSPGLSGLRDATRVLKRQPGFALMVVCTLALGIGAATAIFSVVDGLMLRPLPFRDPERLVQVFIGRGGDGTSVYVDADAARVWRGQDAVFSASHLLGWRSLMLTGPGEPRNLRAELVEPGLLGTLGTPPALGREFLPEEGVPGRDRVVMLSHELWRGAFAADATVIGATIYLDDEPHTVVGVMPSSVRVLPGGIPEIALPLTDPPPSPRGLMLLGRIRSDLSLPVAQARLDAVTARLEAAQPREAGWGVQLTPLERLLNEDTRRGLTALAGAVLLLLFVACVNAAGLLFVRGVTRNAELAIRRSLGASRAMLFRQSLGESLVLAGLAGVAGALLAWWGVHALLALVPEGLIRFSYNAVGINARVLVFAVALTFATGVAFGIGPALRASRTDALHTSRRTATASRAEARLRSVIQAVQLALAVMLLAGAGLFGRSFLRLAAVDPGFDPHDLLQLTYELPTFRYPNPPQRAAFNRDVDAQLRALPGVSDVTWTFGGIDGGGISFPSSIERDGAPPLETEPFELIPQASVDTAYFRIMGIPLREGRSFNPDDLVNDAGSVIIDVDLARRLWPGQSAVGKRFRLFEDAWLTVVGVSEDVKLSGPHEPYGPLFLFYPTGIEELQRPMIVIRAAGDPAVVGPAARRAVQSLDPGLPITLETGDKLRAELVQQPRFLLVVMTVFAVVALILAAIGVYGLVAFTVARRTREFGIRIAVGARGRQIQTSVLARGLIPAAAGLTAGIIAAIWLARFVQSLLFGISPLDPITILAVSLVLAISCIAALLMPSRRAARVDPVEALRAE